MDLVDAHRSDRTVAARKQSSRQSSVFRTYVVTGLASFVGSLRVLKFIDAQGTESDDENIAAFSRSFVAPVGNTAGSAMAVFPIVIWCSPQTQIRPGLSLEY